MRISIVLALAAAQSPFIRFEFVRAGDECKSWTWSNSRKSQTLAKDLSKSIPIRRLQAEDEPTAGDPVCRLWTETGKEVNYYTCTQLAERYDIETELFFRLNPEIDENCSNIEPKTEYCVYGCTNRSAPPSRSQKVQKLMWAGRSATNHQQRWHLWT